MQTMRREGLTEVLTNDHHCTLCCVATMNMDEFIPTGMNHGDFFIGREFMTGSGKWRCTDIGTRVIVAIRIDDHPDDPSWYNGPPYAVAECSFDEYDQQGCTPLPLPDPAQ